MTTPGATSAAAALQADLDAILVLERRIRAAQAEQLRLIERAHGYAHAVEGVHDGVHPGAAGVRHPVVPRRTRHHPDAARAHRRRPGRGCGDGPPAPGHPARARDGGDQPAPGALHLRGGHRAAGRCRGDTRSGRAGPGTTADQRRPASSAPHPAGTAAPRTAGHPTPRRASWTAGWCSNPPPTGWPGSACTSRPNAPTRSRTASTGSPTPIPHRLSRAGPTPRPIHRPPTRAPARNGSWTPPPTCSWRASAPMRTANRSTPTRTSWPGCWSPSRCSPSSDTRRTRRARRVRTHPRRHRPTPRRARTLIPADPHPPRDRRLPLLQPHHLPGPRRPHPLPPNPRRHLPVPRLRPPRHHLRPRPHHPLEPQRPHQPRQPRPPLPPPPPPQTPHPLADDPTPQRCHRLDLTHRPTPHHPPRTPLHPTPIRPAAAR